ncbi:MULTISPECIES: tetratricopeptide repeat protein [Methylobacterium]|uniref:Sel1 repeat family protein n=1 Tax=Methylobacterium jeotgali TaxID=381630 RepID=A0ABQ4T1D6_9HYPH|nr:MULTISPECIES: tetratricopeptide repeat protein [Methylobacterium]GBU19593.1 HcpA family protein [Methylobacterium sp.]GJE08842.1 hypothetical protein AOPFMNJM_4188 [Methylobacterium jeotgali]
MKARPAALAASLVIASQAAYGAPSPAAPEAKPVTTHQSVPTRELPSPYTANYVGGAVPPRSALPPDFAYGAYQRGQYVTAFREATKRIEADRKDVAAMVLLGELYNQGLGTKQDALRAAEWYRLAAAEGEPNAMASLGLMAMDGRGMPRDEKAGRAWLEKAAAKGQPTAAYNLAILLLATGNEADIARAATLYRTAAEGEIGSAQHGLGVLYLKGLGVPKDPKLAAQWFRRAADNGDLAGEVEFAILLFNGTGVPKDEVRAARYFLHAASRGNAIAQNRVARLFATGRGLPKNLVEAAAWNLAASAQGLSDAWLDQTLNGLGAEERTRAERLANDRINVR